MKIKPYINKLNGSKEFKSFMKQNSKAFMIAGFFILDLENKKNVHQIDYYAPSSKKVAAFTLDGGVNMQMLSLMNSSKIPEKLDITTKIDLDSLYGILEDEMKNRSITDDIKKIIAVLQSIDGKKVWNLNCLLSGMGILRAHIDDDSQTVLKMEKASLLDYIKRVNPAELQGMAGGQQVATGAGQGAGAGMPQAGQMVQMPQADAQEQQAVPNEKLSKKDVEERVKKLDQLKEAIEEEKKRISKASSGKDSKEEKVSKKSKKK